MKRPCRYRKVGVVLWVCLVALAACGREPTRSSTDDGGPADPPPDGGEPTRPPTDSDYPTVLKHLSADSLASLRRACRLANPGFCFDLDAYGLVSDEPPGCFIQGAGASATADRERIADIARSWLVRNAAYTGVTAGDSPALEYFLFTDYAGSANDHYQLIFEPQVFEGLTVEHTRVIVEMDSVSVLYMGGHHYQSIHVPGAVLTGAEAESALVGLSIPWYGFAGDRLVYVVPDSSFCPSPSLAVYPVETGQGMELRLAWRCGISWGDCWTAWAAFVDAVTGEVLGVTQLFYT